MLFRSMIDYNGKAHRLFCVAPMMDWINKLKKPLIISKIINSFFVGVQLVCISG